MGGGGADRSIAHLEKGVFEQNAVGKEEARRAVMWSWRGLGTGLRKEEKAAGAQERERERDRRKWEQTDINVKRLKCAHMCQF